MIPDKPRRTASVSDATRPPRTPGTGRLSRTAAALLAGLLVLSLAAGSVSARPSTDVVTARVSYPGAHSGNARNALHAALIVDGFMLEPGQVFSFNQVVGRRTRDRGFISGLLGDGSSTVGSGVCRTSTTLFNAALDMGLEIVERHPHNIPVNYVPRGRDAAIWWGVKDLRFRNNATFSILINMSGSLSHLEAVFTPQTLARYPKAALKVDDEPVETDVPPVLVEGRVLVPLRWVSEALGALVEWDAAARIARVFSQDLPEDHADKDSDNNQDCDVEDLEQCEDNDDLTDSDADATDPCDQDSATDAETEGDDCADEAAAAADLAGDLITVSSEYYKGHRVVVVMLDGKVLETDVPAVIMDGRVLVPVRWVSEGLGAGVRWDQGEMTVYVESCPEDADTVDEDTDTETPDEPETTPQAGDLENEGNDQEDGEYSDNDNSLENTPDSDTENLEELEEVEE